MRTAESMFNYCLENDFGQGSFKKWGPKHFAIIEKNLQPDEKVLMTFIGLHNYISMSKHENNFAYAITNKRIIFGQKKLLAGEIVKSISLDFINDVTLETATGVGLLANGVITFDTMKDTFNVMVNAKQANNILQKIQGILFDKKKSDSNDNKKASEADEIRKYKDLLDDGIITEEEFDKKKKELLGI
ncbi:PH domain-containing protein [Tissierella praeacuta]|uniref:PH domain-containing protein n=1 Tax=Tissierella praeacuta TaxID=43131 RepID=UPI00333E98E9